MSEGERKIKVAIMGPGRSGYNIHVRWLVQVPGKYEIVAVADQLPTRRAQAMEELGCRTYSDWRELLKGERGQAELVINSLPSPLHVDATIEAFKSGFHVVSEKPLAKKVADVDRILAAEQSSGNTFFPFQQNRLQPFFDKMQEVIASGVLGEIVHIKSSWSGFSRRWDWQTRQDLWGGSLLNTGPHAVDQALCLFGWENDPEVFCRMDSRNPFDGDAENHCTVCLYDGRPAAEGMVRRPQIDIDISSFMPGNRAGDSGGSRDTYVVSGTCGHLWAGARQVRWRYFDPSAAPTHDMWLWSGGVDRPEERVYPREELEWVEESWDVEQAKLEGAVGYTLESLQDGQVR
jgi:scyllo-inositol 2-dehydrogenase (NADP+)